MCFLLLGKNRYGFFRVFFGFFIVVGRIFYSRICNLYVRRGAAVIIFSIRTVFLGFVMRGSY